MDLQDRAGISLGLVRRGSAERLRRTSERVRCPVLSAASRRAIAVQPILDRVLHGRPAHIVTLDHPFVIEVVGAQSPPEMPSGYVMTLALGRLLVQGVRFTQPALEVELVTEWGFLDIWPPTDTFPWPALGLADHTTLDRMNQAQTFVSQTAGVRLSPFTPATELPASILEGRLIRLPLACGEHEAFYPAGWHRNAAHGEVLHIPHSL